MSKQLGHSTVTITLDRYSQLMPNVAEAVAVQLDALYVSAEAAPAPNNVTELRPALWLLGTLCAAALGLAVYQAA